MLSRGVGKVTYIVLMIILFIIGIFAGYGIGLGAAPTKITTATITITTPAPGPGAVVSTVTVPAPTTIPYTITIPTPGAALPKEIPIGVLDALSGAFASYGIRGQYAAKLAERDINDFVSKLGLGVRFVFYYEDYATDPSVALQKAQTLAAKGVKVIIGGLISGATKQITPYATANKIVVITGTSTAPREVVAPPGGYVFRTLPTVEYEGVGTAALMKQLGYTSAILITADETYTQSFRKAFLDSAKAAGIKIVLDLVFPTDQKDFSPLLDQMEREVSARLGKEKIAIVASTWEDHAAIILQQAQARRSVVLQVPWFAADTIPLSTLILQQALEPAAKAKLIGALFTPAASKVYDSIRERMLKDLGQEPDIYALAEYDAAWIAALAILLAGKYDGDAIKNAVPLAAKIYWGATGNIEFNEKGDRAYADLIFYAVIGKDWAKVAIYRVLTGTIEWLIPREQLGV
ncbi:MAG: ABC transporter substrate-binding protein [Sulfolobales archaeon]|jgi:branched-chain amino acid transport system substrate-binding protein